MRLHHSKILFVVALVSSVMIISSFENAPLATGFQAPTRLINPSSSTSLPTVPTSTQATYQPNTTFKSIKIDSSPVPHVPFKISVDLNSGFQTANLVATLSIPPGVSVTSPLIVNLPNTGWGSDRVATWTLIAGSAGSYPINIIVYTDNPSETDTFNIDALVGTPESLIVSGVDVPGNITPDQTFKVGVTLKNVANVIDQNLLAQISVPSGLLLLDDVSSGISSIRPNQEVEFNWKVKAQAVGSYVLGINYSSTNAGDNSYELNVNVGKSDVPSGALLSIASHSPTFSPNSNDPVLFDIKNNGIESIHNLQIVSASGGGFTSADTPFWIGELGIDQTRVIPLHIYTTNSSLQPGIPMSVQYSAGGNDYSETYHVALPLANQPIFKINTVTLNPPLTFAGDAQDRIDVRMSNYGTAAYGVSTTMNLPPGLSPAWGNATSVYIDRINPFETVSASYYVNVDSKLSSGNYPLTLLINSGNQTAKLNVNLIIAPKAQFQVVQVDDSQLYPGATASPFKIMIKNNGAAVAQTIVAKLLAGNEIPGTKSSTITNLGDVENIGNVLPGQTFTATFLVDPDPTLTGDQHASVELDWVQNYTNPTTAQGTSASSFVQTLAVPYHVASGPSYILYYNGIPWSYVFIAAAFAIGITIFIRMRKKRIKRLELAATHERAVEKGDLFSPTSLGPLQDLSQEISDEKNFRVKGEVLPKKYGKTAGKDKDMS